MYTEPPMEKRDALDCIEELVWKSRQDGAENNDARLCRLAIRVEQEVAKLRANPGLLIERAAARRNEEVPLDEVGRAVLAGLDDDRFFCTLLVLIWRECEAAVGGEQAAVAERRARRLLEWLEHRAFDRFFSSSRFLHPSLLAWVILKLATVFSELGVSPLLADTSEKQELLEELLEALQKDRSLRPGERFWDHLYSWVVGEPSCHRETCLVTFARLLVTAAEPQRVRVFLLGFTDDSLKQQAQAAVVETFLKTGRKGDAYSFCGEGMSRHVQEALSNEVANRVSARELDVAEEIAGWMVGDELRARSLAVVAEGWCQEGDLMAALRSTEAALALAERTALPGELVGAFITLVSAASRQPVAQQEPFVRLLLRLEKLVASIQEEEARDRLLADLPAVWASLGCLREARELAERLSQRVPVDALTSLAKGLSAAGGDEAEIEALLARALAAARGVSFSLGRAYALLEVAFSLATTARATQAAATFYEALAAVRSALADREENWTATLAGRVFHCLAQSPDFEGRSRLLREALELVLAMEDPWWQSRALAQAPVALKALSTEMEVNAWVEDLLDMAQLREHEAVLEPLAFVLLEKGRGSDVLRCVAASLKAGARAELAAKLARRAYSLDQTELGEGLFAEAVAAAEADPGQERVGRTLLVVSQLLEVGCLDLAASAASRLKPRDLCWRAQGLVALAWIERGAAERGMRQLLSGVSDVWRPEEAPWDLPALAVIVEELGRHSKVAEVVAFLRCARRWAVGLQDEAARCEALSSLAELIATGPAFPERGPLLAELASDLGRSPLERRELDCLQRVARAQFQPDDSTGALATAGRLGEVGRAWLLKDLALLQLEAGRGEEAAGLLSSALDGLTGVRFRRGERQIFNHLAKAVARLEESGGRQRLFRQLLDEFGRIELDTERAEALQELGIAVADSCQEAWVSGLLGELVPRIEAAEMSSLSLPLEERRAEVWAKAGEYQAALDKVRQLGPVTREGEHALWRVLRVAAARGQAEVIATAWRLVAPDDYSRVPALEALAAGLAEAPKGSPLLEVLAGPLSDLEKVEAPHNRSRLLWALLESLPEQVRSGAWLEQLARRLLTALETAMYHAPTPPARASALSFVIQGWAALGETNHALAVLDQADAGELASAAVAGLLRVLSVRNEQGPEDLLTVLERVISSFESPVEEAKALTALAMFVARAGRLDGASSLFVQAARRLLADSGKQEPVEALCLIVEGLIATGLAQQAREAVELVLSRVSTLADSHRQGQVVGAVAKALPFLGNVQGIERHLEGTSVSGEVRRLFVCGWRQALLAMPAPPLATLRYTLGCFPLEAGLGLRGAQCLAAGLLKNGATEAYQDLLLQCPEIGLEPVITGDSQPCQVS